MKGARGRETGVAQFIRRAQRKYGVVGCEGFGKGIEVYGHTCCKRKKIIMSQVRYDGDADAGTDLGRASSTSQAQI